MSIRTSWTGKLAVSTGSAPVEGAFAFAVEHGLAWLEFACQEPVNHPSTFDPERTQCVRSLMQHNAVQGIVHSASAVNTAETDPGVRAAVQTHLTDYVKFTHALGCEILVVHAGYEFDLDLDLAVHSACTTLSAVARTAEDLGVQLVLENMNVLPAAAEIRYLGCTAQDVRHILDTVDSPALTSCVDIGHAHLLPGGATEFIAALDGRIGYAQLTDNDGVVDDHLALGDGNLDVIAALNSLDAAGYTGPLAIELAGRADCVRSIERLRELRAID